MATLHFQDTSNPGMQSYSISTDPLWALPNTVPMLLADTRLTNEAGGVQYFGPIPYRTPAEKANDILLRVSWLRTAMEPIRPVSKFRYSLLIQGPDGLNSPLFLGRDPRDSIVADTCPPFPTFGVLQCESYYDEMWGLLRDALDGAGLPHPMMVWANIESRGDVINSSFLSPTTGIWPQGLADVRANQWKVDGQRTVQEWAAERTVRLDGTAYPAYVSGSPQLDENFDISQRCNALINTAFGHAIDRGIRRPLQSAFGNVPFAEWDLYADSRSSPALLSSLKLGYDTAGYMPLDASVLVCYSNNHLPNNLYGSTELLWQERYGITGFNARARSGRAQMNEWAHQVRNATGKPVWMSVSIADWVEPTWSLVNQTLRTAIEDEMAGVIGDQDAKGSDHVYVFQPGYWTSAEERASWLRVAGLTQGEPSRLTQADPFGSSISRMWSGGVGAGVVNRLGERP